MKKPYKFKQAPDINEAQKSLDFEILDASQKKELIEKHKIREDRISCVDNNISMIYKKKSAKKTDVSISDNLKKFISHLGAIKLKGIDYKTGKESWFFILLPNTSILALEIIKLAMKQDEKFITEKMQMLKEILDRTEGKSTPMKEAIKKQKIIVKLRKNQSNNEEKKQNKN